MVSAARFRLVLVYHHRLSLIDPPNFDRHFGDVRPEGTSYCHSAAAGRLRLWLRAKVRCGETSTKQRQRAYAAAGRSAPGVCVSVSCWVECGFGLSVCVSVWSATVIGCSFAASKTNPMTPDKPTKKRRRQGKRKKKRKLNYSLFGNCCDCFEPGCWVDVCLWSCHSLTLYSV